MRIVEFDSSHVRTRFYKGERWTERHCYPDTMLRHATADEIATADPLP